AIFPAASGKMRSPAALAASQSAAASSSVCVAVTNTSNPRAISPTTRSWTATRARDTRWTNAFTGVPVDGARHRAPAATPAPGSRLAARPARRAPRPQQALPALDAGHPFHLANRRDQLVELREVRHLDHEHALGRPVL